MHMCVHVCVYVFEKEMTEIQEVSLTMFDNVCFVFLEVVLIMFSFFPDLVLG